MRTILNLVYRFMNKYYGITSILMVVVFVIIIALTGSVASCNLAKKQYIDTTLLHKEKAYRDSIYKDSCLQKVAAAKLNSLCNKWDTIFVYHQQSLNKSQEALNQNLSIWLAVIAAICTILPIVLGMNQYLSQQYRLEEFSKDFNSKKENLLSEIDQRNNELKREITTSMNSLDVAKKEMSNQVKEHQSKLCHTEVISLLNMLSQNLNLLCNLQDIENKENPVLTSPDLVKGIISSLDANVNRCNSKFFEEKDKLDASSLLAIQNALMSTACSIRDMIYLYENVFNGQKLLNIQRLRDELSFFILDKISTFKEASEGDVDDTFKQIVGTTKTLTRLFDSLGNEE